MASDDLRKVGNVDKIDADPSDSILTVMRTHSLNGPESKPCTDAQLCPTPLPMPSSIHTATTKSGVAVGDPNEQERNGGNPSDESEIPSKADIGPDIVVNIDKPRSEVEFPESDSPQTDAAAVVVVRESVRFTALKGLSVWRQMVSPEAVGLALFFTINVVILQLYLSKPSLPIPEPCDLNLRSDIPWLEP